MSKINELILLSYRSRHNYEASLEFLEKAHLLSQPYAIPHFKVHWEMLKLAMLFKVPREIFGQILRLILAIPGSWLGRAPRGNIGSTKMGIFEEKIKD